MFVIPFPLGSAVESLHCLNVLSVTTSSSYNALKMFGNKPIYFLIGGEKYYSMYSNVSKKIIYRMHT